MLGSVTHGRGTISYVVSPESCGEHLQALPRKKKIRAARFIKTADGSIMTKWHHSFCPDLIAETYNKVL